MMNTSKHMYTIASNDYLGRATRAYAHCAYASYYGNCKDAMSIAVSDDVRTLKNQFRDKAASSLQDARERIARIVACDLDSVLRNESLSEPLIMCVPRSKADFVENQLQFRGAVHDAAHMLSHRLSGVTDGTAAIKRIVDTKTTHLRRTCRGDMSGSGRSPYPGITRDTCRLDMDVRGRCIVLVDDIYTQSVNVDEDCIQFLLDQGAKGVMLYTLCKTLRRF